MNPPIPPDLQDEPLAPADPVAHPPPVAWPWAVITQPPAPVPVLATRWACERAAEAIAGILERSARLAIVTAPHANADFEPVFGAVFEVGGMTGQGIVALDADAARLLINAMAPAPDGVAPAAPGPVALPTAGEFGLLEFLAIAVVDHLARLVPDHADRLRLIGLHDGGAIRTRMRGPGDEGVIDLNLDAGGSAGRCRLLLAGLDPQDIAAITEAPTPAANDTLTLELAFAPIELTRQAFDTIQPGDVLVIGGSDLPTAAGGVSVVTSTGWSLGLAEIERDAPLTTNAVLQHPWLASPCAAVATDHVAIRPRIGASSHTLSEVVQRVRSGPALRLSFAKQEQSPVTFWADGRCVGAGEPVILDNELAIRITDWHTAPSHSSPSAP